VGWKWLGRKGTWGKKTKLVQVLWADCDDVVALVSNDRSPVWFRCGGPRPKSSRVGRLCHSDHGVFVTARRKSECQLTSVWPHSTCTLMAAAPRVASSESSWLCGGAPWRDVFGFTFPH